MISGLVSPKSIGFTNREDINQLLKKFNLMFKFSKLMIIRLGFAGFRVSLMPFIINSTFPLIFFEIFWALFYGSYVYFTSNITLSQMTYFFIICLYLKLKLRNANNNIRKYFEKKYKMTYHKMKNILISLDSIVSEINTYNNDLWSKYLMIVLILVILVVDLVFFEVFFKKKKKMNFFFKMILFYCSSTAFLILIIVINTASSASFEANKSYKQLNKLFTVDNKQLSIRIRIKV
jgi:hypothetical protein